MRPPRDRVALPTALSRSSDCISFAASEVRCRQEDRLLGRICCRGWHSCANHRRGPISTGGLLENPMTAALRWHVLAHDGPAPTIASAPTDMRRNKVFPARGLRSSIGHHPPAIFATGKRERTSLPELAICLARRRETEAIVHRLPICCAGLPATTNPEGTSRITTAPAPMTDILTHYATRGDRGTRADQRPVPDRHRGQ